MELWNTFIEGTYSVSNRGSVRSIDRYVSFKNTKKFVPGVVLKPNLNRDGYLIVKICIDGLQFSESVHRIVAKAWVVNPLDLIYVNHIDGNKQNNCASNLEWCTFSENILHAYSLGLCKRGAKHSKAILTEADIPSIRLRIRAGETNKQIGDSYNVHRGTIDAIRRSKSWKHIK